MNHDDAYELLSALALDAVDDDERALIEEHVATCQRCQVELDSLRAVAGVMGNLVEELPEELWSSISSRIYEQDDAVPELVPPPPIPTIGTSPQVIRLSARARWAAIPIGLAAAVIAVLSFSLSNANDKIDNLQSALRAGEVAAAMKAPGHEVVDLRSPTSGSLAKFVLLRDGRGYLVSSELPTLDSRQTYQLWGIVNGKAISIGLMGRAPHDVTFTVSGPPKPATLAVTVEPAGGTQTPTGSMVATGAV